MLCLDTYIYYDPVSKQALGSVLFLYIHAVVSIWRIECMHAYMYICLDMYRHI